MYWKAFKWRLVKLMMKEIDRFESIDDWFYLKLFLFIFHHDILSWHIIYLQIIKKIKINDTSLTLIYTLGELKMSYKSNCKIKLEFSNITPLIFIIVNCILWHHHGVHCFLTIAIYRYIDLLKFQPSLLNFSCFIFIFTFFFFFFWWIIYETS